MKYFHKTVTPPHPYCIYEILIQIFYRFFYTRAFLRKAIIQKIPEFYEIFS